MEIGQSAGKSFAYVLGVFLGDGCIDNPKRYGRPGDWLRFRLNSIDADFVEAVKAALGEIVPSAVWVGGPYNDHRSRHSRQFYTLWCGHQVLCNTLLEMTQSKTALPPVVFDWPRDRKLALIAGLMDSEGFVAAHQSRPITGRFYMGFKCCDPWIADFIRLLESVGIRIGKVSVEEPRKPGYKAPTRFTIKMQSWVTAGGYFNIARKQARVEAWSRRLTSETTRQTPAQPVMI